jgi:hypothetical protein
LVFMDRKVSPLQTFCSVFRRPYTLIFLPAVVRFA